MEFKKIKLPFKIKKPTLALGSQTKNTACFLKDNFALISPVHQDLNNPADYLKFEKTVSFFLRKRPKVIAYDLHPEYQSSKYVHHLSPITYRLSPIQHHHAHIASCMAENGLKNNLVIGVAFDGTGLGSDNTLWGAEFLVSNYKNFQRKAHLKEIPLLGKEKAILEPWRLAVVWLYLLYKDGLLNLDIGFIKKIEKQKWRVLKNIYLSGFNSQLSSSMGRLFDALASLILEKHKAGFEAELAIELEKLATGYKLPTSSCPFGRRSAGSEARGYNFKIGNDKDVYIIDPLPMFKAIVDDLKVKVPKEKIAYRFHLTVSQMIKETCVRLRKESKINKVVLSGGVFQNQLLLSLSLDALSQENFNVFTHNKLSCNDSGISLGQATIANF